jgi:hypothetical protein
MNTKLLFVLSILTQWVNIDNELRLEIPSSALRAPSPHVWGEGKKEVVH